jgi:hypothetical protein
MNYITGTINYFLYLLGYENKNNKDFEDPGDFIIFDFPKPEKTWKSLMENIKKDKNLLRYNSEIKKIKKKKMS